MTVNEFSSMGTYHCNSNGENQDALCHGRNGDFSVISLADGVSACKEARCGAEIASKAITNLLLKKGEYFFEFEEKQIAEFALSHILYELKQQAAKENREVQEYSSTAASVLFDKKHGRMLCFNLGDSMIMAAGKGRCTVLAIPSDSSSGCCVITTRNAASMISVKALDAGSIESVMICSDGAWKQMFFKNRLKQEIAALLVDGGFQELKEYLTKQECFDDCSFIAMDLPRKNRRKSA